MHLTVTRMRHHGKALEQHQIRTAESISGDVVLSHNNVSALGRYADVAIIQASGTSEVIPALHDVKLSAMGTNGFVLSGIEFLPGSIAFAQAWWCRLKG